MLPALPNWDNLHPLIIHFPIALLLVAPVLVILSMGVRKYARPFAYAALLLMVLGTGALFVAVSTGEAAGELAEGNGAVEQVLERHEDLAELTQTIFSIITIAYALVVLAPLVAKKAQATLPWTAVNGAILVFYLAGAVFLANTGHEGGRLVHEFGVHAMMTPTPPSFPSPSPQGRSRRGNTTQTFP
jgi:uncharacterized membrane protein